MNLVIVGSVALDDVKTPLGEVKNALGGSAVYSSLSAQYFTQAGVVGVVGHDFPENYLQTLAARSIRLEGLEKAPGETFHWAGYYEYDMGSAKTLDTRLNVFAAFDPKIPSAFKSVPYLFLANIDPELQTKVLNQITRPRFTLLDTMNFWIETKREALLAVFPRVDMVVVNDAEARQLAGTPNLLQAARWIRNHGPRGVIIKKGEHGALLFWENEIAALPAFPLDTVRDPTGAGDTFAGGFIGALAGSPDLTMDNFRRAAAMGTIMASFTVEDFSTRRLEGLSEEEIRARYRALQKISELKDFAGDFSSNGR
ncbi:MAG: sugar kinase [Candidatus Firestonebacteria bacterium]|nr:sugar kinase [Candidatus Firestonebacteria bacterium]